MGRRHSYEAGGHLNHPRSFPVSPMVARSVSCPADRRPPGSPGVPKRLADPQRICSWTLLLAESTCGLSWGSFQPGDAGDGVASDVLGHRLCPRWRNAIWLAGGRPKFSLRHFDGAPVPGPGAYSLTSEGAVLGMAGATAHGGKLHRCWCRPCNCFDVVPSPLLPCWHGRAATALVLPPLGAAALLASRLAPPR